MELEFVINYDVFFFVFSGYLSFFAVMWTVSHVLRLGRIS